MGNKHTEGEWVALIMHRHIRIMGGTDDNPIHIADIKCKGLSETEGLPVLTAQANAIHIVKCVNTHDELIKQNEMLKNSLRMIVDKRNSAGWDAECSALLAEDTLKEVSKTTATEQTLK
jgi:hypothetical protein